MAGKKAIILIVDDEESLRDSMRILLSADYDLIFAANGNEALQILKNNSPHLIFLDIRMPDMNGLEVLSKIKEMDLDIDVIMVTAMNTVSYAVEAMRRGAYDYLTKPFDIEAIQAIIEKALEKRKLAQENVYLKEEIEKKYQFEKIVGKSSAIYEVFSLITSIAKSESTVLIQGESGTGKELAARAIHNLSGRGKKLFVAVNCAAIPENLLESELFGHERGSFTGAFERKIGKFEFADSGTIFLDEIGSLPLSMQGKLLRVLQEKEIERVGGLKPIAVDVRIISASNRDLRKLIEEGKFRIDLFYRLNVIPINIPPLRERKEDVALLVDHFIKIYSKEFSKGIKGLTQKALKIFENYSWPGNVRELQNLIERLIVLAKGPIIDENHLPKEITDPETELNSPGFSYLSFKDAQMKFESSFIRKALLKTGGSKNKAAKMLGIHRNTLLNIEKKLGL
ncbi:MAG: two component sigma54 specific Fis family transcriptional regulator [Candidatus Saganbacteria bacterium]|uniref:Two component sigma54 specific Fis family transcriptional regulator n=1 Tax=Candidatus Saganbacteria bacterium TaxID=2575572 RepID=A0A833KZJ2_UNCSA|nr:MAG: two component sigma54 specific Fis family transcriptional regulator [Candidatus Saganbacteria bacterium]